MPDFDNTKQLYKYLQKSLKGSIEDIAEKLEGEVKDQIDLEVYQSYSPTKYQRTYQLRDSITSKIEDDAEGFSLNIFHDNSKMNGYTSLHSGGDISNAIPEIVTEGLAPNIFNSRDYSWMHSRDYFAKSEERFKTEKIVESEIKKALNKRGVDTR